MKKYLLLTLFTTTLFSCHEYTLPGPGQLKIEYGSAVCDVSIPRFSWIMTDSTRGAAQTAYHVLLATSPALLTEKHADIWNSGIIQSDQSVFVDYTGDLLESGSRYFWSVRTLNREGEVSEWAHPAFFDMGLLSLNDWKAKWIGADDSRANADSLRPESILLRKEFDLSNRIKSAKMYTSGLGSYQVFLNGEKVSDDLLTPGWTDYPTRVQYQVYDVKDHLVKGGNAVGFILGNMWYSSGLGWKGAEVYSNGPMKAIMQLEIEYRNGDIDLFTTGEDWKWHYSPILENTIYHGEVYDARLEIEKWNEVDLDESDWEPVDVYEGTNMIMSAQFSPTIRVTKRIRPVGITQLENGSYLFDMGINMTGGIRLNVNGDKGTKVVMKFAELLHEDGTVAQENLRSAKATDTYVLKGGEPESWSPTFTYHGFRYVEISGLPHEPDTSTVIGLNFHNDAAVTGSFSCSNELLNQIQANIQNGQKSNMFSVPTDCPQRDERLGWMGDAQIFAATSCYNMDMSGFYAKWIRDIADSQDESGYVKDVNPAIVVTDPAKPAWGDAFLIVPWEIYRFYGDKRILESYMYEYQKWIDYMTSRSTDDLYIYDRNGWGGYGDWIAVVSSDPKPISAAYYYQSTSLLSDFAGIIGQNTIKEKYAGLAMQIRTAFINRFFDRELVNYPGGTQTAMLLPLNFGLTEKQYQQPVAQAIAKNVMQRGNHASTGFLGTKYLLPTLSNYGFHELAYLTATNNEYPSLGYMVENGASSIWELWNSDKEPPHKMNSRNHFALGSTGEWFYSHLAGIQIDDLNPGFKHSIVAPMPAEGLNWVKATVHTPYGPLQSSWEKTGGRMSLHIRIPANTTATIRVPLLSDVRTELYESGEVLVKEDGSFAEANGIKVTGIDTTAIILNVTSGNYNLEYLY